MPFQSEPDVRSNKEWCLDLGANVLDDRKTTKFTVWAPYVSHMDLATFNDDGSESLLQMEKNNDNYFSQIAGVGNGTKYFYLLDHDKRRADPASKFQPDGVHGPSQVVDDSSFKWTDGNWRGVSIDDLIIYELHVGTYTQEGTFNSLTSYIDYLVQELGVTAIELMPVAEFPGARNWGYDGVFMFAPQNSYGGPESLKSLVNSCHNKRLAVILDVVYNHLGPEGNYLQDFGPYFSYKYRTPWGPSFNYDDRGCDDVRKYVISNALYWITNYHFDGLRLDAIHGIFDFSPKNILEDIKDAVQLQAKELRREITIIAESDLNDPRIIRSKKTYGYGLDAQWSDDFHHSVHAYLTGETFGYYQDFGSLEDIAKSLTDGFVYDGKYSVFRGKKHGKSSLDIPGKKLVVFLQNHDQVGNRPDGSRLRLLLKEKRLLKVTAGLLILSPYVPLLFMGEEFGEPAPFYYFINHTDPDLVKAVRDGRRKEFESNNWGIQYIDPQDERTFAKSKINHSLRVSNYFNRELFDYYRELIRLRKTHPALSYLEKKNMGVSINTKEKTLLIRRRCDSEELLLVYNLGPDGSKISHTSEGEKWTKIHDSNESSFYSSDEKKSYYAPEVLSFLNRDFLFPPFTLAIYRRT